TLIRRATAEDASAIADLTRRAFASQALLYEDDSLPPLADTAQSVAAEISTGWVVLVAEVDGVLVGSIRGVLRDATCHVGRLVVEPDLQGRGLGRSLAMQLEACFPDAERFEIFTGHRSEPALGLYESLGYSRERVIPVHERLSLIILGKPGDSSRT
ncbi:MAG: GNAT family N-acetyltransferase, partial [Actinomycetota bacterium]|nr:GNAT family N-acetyltransferase [Actinomycetota bacterium]